MHDDTYISSYKSNLPTMVTNFHGHPSTMAAIVIPKTTLNNQGKVVIAHLRCMACFADAKKNTTSGGGKVGNKDVHHCESQAIGHYG